MRSIFNIISQKKSETPLLRKAAVALIVEEANNVLREIFGDQIRRFAEVVYLKDGALSIKCTSPSAAQEIKLNEKEIIAKISQKTNSELVNRVRYIN